MTVYFDISGIVFVAHGVKHEREGKPSFELRHVYLQGNCGDLLPLLKSGNFLDQVEEEAAVAAQSPAGGVFSQQRLPRMNMDLSVTLAEVNARRGFPTDEVEDLR